MSEWKEEFVMPTDNHFCIPTGGGESTFHNLDQHNHAIGANVVDHWGHVYDWTQLLADGNQLMVVQPVWYEHWWQLIWL